MSEHNQQSQPWWRQLHLQTGESLCFILGPLNMLVARQEKEWQIATRHEQSPSILPADWELTLGNEDPTAENDFQRFVFRSTQPHVQLRPMQADRAVVVRPDSVLRLPPGEEITIYVSLPLWIAVHVGQSLEKLCEFPVIRPSDTWLGASTREGALCYDSRTRGRLRITDDPMARYRVITPLHIRNHADDIMLLERVSMPAVNLSIFGSDDGRLWSSNVTMTRQAENDTVTLDISSAPPKEAGRLELVTEPRESSEKLSVVSVLSAFFG